MTRMSNLAFERHCLKRYEEIIQSLMKRLEEMSTLEEDLKLLAVSTPNGNVKAKARLTPNQRCALIYRIERNRIIKSQLEIIRYLQQVFDLSFLMKSFI